jgi:hypothetical protein
MVARSQLLERPGNPPSPPGGLIRLQLSHSDFPRVIYSGETKDNFVTCSSTLRNFVTLRQSDLHPWPRGVFALNGVGARRSYSTLRWVSLPIVRGRLPTQTAALLFSQSQLRENKGLGLAGAQKKSGMSFATEASLTFDGQENYPNVRRPLHGLGHQLMVAWILSESGGSPNSVPPPDPKANQNEHHRT